LYRKRRVYAKSVETYKRERARRKRVLQLHEQGFTQVQIAAEIGCSAKTVSRDLKKLRRYVRGEEQKELRQANENFMRAVQEKLACLPLALRFEIRSDLLVLGLNKDYAGLFEATRHILLGTYKKRVNRD
jgi:predicted transcriptional regulator